MWRSCATPWTAAGCRSRSRRRLGTASADPRLPAGFPAAHGVDGEPLRPGRVYVAPPDQHLLVERERIQITRGRKENRFRPAVDALFRSAAYALLQGACRGIS
ncbi:MAG TPA: chemotaxis protein CheB [Roseiflexaceae bacterium]|nr:chemotaxis protein CheB [Roseiflexaceae bacterium]